MSYFSILLSFFFNDPAPTEIYTLSLHDALPISKFSEGGARPAVSMESAVEDEGGGGGMDRCTGRGTRSEEHTSELQSLRHLVCRLLLEKKKKKKKTIKLYQEK